MMLHKIFSMVDGPTWIMYILYLASVMPVLVSMQLSIVNKRLCSSLCQCTSKTVDCNHQDRLSFIPSIISADYNQLHISHAFFETRGLSKVNFSSITHLTSLKIVYSKLESLHDDTFILMDQLDYMDLSHNSFTIIEPRAFYGLSLKNLYLESNQAGLTISSNMFEGLKVINLYLRSNGIVAIPVTTFEHLNLVKLYLFNNSITAVDRKFASFFSASENLLDLTKNPLYCSCGFSWFPELINQWRSVPAFVNITCQKPIILQNRPLSKLSKYEFPCETPSINKISVDVSENYIHLMCHARGKIPPKISWTQMNSENGNEVPHFEEMTSVNHQSYVSINVSKLQNDNSFLCKTWNEINSSNEILVKLKLIDRFFEKLKTPLQIDDNFKSQLPRNPNPQPPPPPETHFLFTKQFSILQMIGAVVGTFTSVILLIFVICCTQEHLIKKNANSNPYWTTIPAEMKTSYSRVVAKTPIAPSMAMVTSSNSQDYDIPQYHESNNFLQSYYTERNVPHYVDGKPANYFSTVT